MQREDTLTAQSLALGTGWSGVRLGASPLPPRPQHCAGAPVKAQRNPRDRGDRVRPGRPGECAERQRIVQPQSPGSAGGEGPERRRRDGDTAARPTE